MRYTYAHIDGDDTQQIIRHRSSIPSSPYGDIRNVATYRSGNSGDNQMYQALEVPSESTYDHPTHADLEEDDNAGSTAAHSHGASRKIKVLLYSHDTFGLGHLRRNLAIVEGLLRPSERFSVQLLTGS